VEKGQANEFIAIKGRGVVYYLPANGPKTDENQKQMLTLVARIAALHRFLFPTKGK
jgi:hypothetical protein